MKIRSYVEDLLSRLSLALKLLVLIVNVIVEWLIDAANRYAIVNTSFVDNKSQAVLWHLQTGCEYKGFCCFRGLLAGVPQKLPDVWRTLYSSLPKLLAPLVKLVLCHGSFVSRSSLDSLPTCLALDDLF